MEWRIIVIAVAIFVAAIFLSAAMTIGGALH
jgi:hypothetical protein